MYEYIYRTQPDDEGHQYGFKAYHKGTFESVILWCKDQFGEGSYNGRWFCTESGSHFWFRDEIDAFAFRMRFC